MPWNSQGGGGGPWGSGGGGGGGGPWGRGPGSGGGSPGPDFEDLIRKSQDKFKRALPGGFGGGKGIALIVVAALALWGATGFYRVNTEEQGVVLRFGKWVETTGPGLHYALPAPISTVLTPAVTRVNQISLGESGGSSRVRNAGSRVGGAETRMLTGDENIVDLRFSVFWRIKDAGEFLFKIRDPEGTITVAAESVMRDIVGQTPINNALAGGRQGIENSAQQRLQVLLDEYSAGIEVTQVQLQGVDPPTPVVDAFNDVQRAKADQERLRNEAEAYRNDIIPRARGEAEKLVQEAEAYKEQVVNLAQGDAQRFTDVLAAYKTAEGVTARRLYLETMESVLKGSNKIIIDPAAQGASGVVPYLPLPELQGRTITTTDSAKGGTR